MVSASATEGMKHLPELGIEVGKERKLQKKGEKV